MEGLNLRPPDYNTSALNHSATLPPCALALHLATLKTIGETCLYKKVKKWCAQGQKGNLSYRFTGKETKIMCHKFMHLLQAISSPNDIPIQQLQICSFVFIGLQLRDAISRFSRVSVTQGEVQVLQESCRKYFTASSRLLDSVTPTVTSSPVDRVNSESESNPRPSHWSAVCSLRKYKACCKHKYVYDSL